MHDINVILAELPGLGRIRLCECNSVHLSIGPITLNLELAAFQQMAELMVSATEQLEKIRESQDGEREITRMLSPLQSRMTH
jgi:hypothetical protein